MRLFVDQLTNVDFSYLCPKRGIVGETWLANIELIGELDEQGMVCDFGIVKREIRNWLDNTLDHKLAVPAASSAYTASINADVISLSFECAKGLIKSTSPTEAIAEIDIDLITPSSVARWCEHKLKKLFAKSVREVKVNFSTEDIKGPFYHYTHGLKKHDGNCQRIAHGHRSQIAIWKDDELQPQLMTEWANKWQDIYIGTQEDIKEESDKTFTFAYTSSQGSFELQAPKSLCYIINTDTTVELLAEHIACSLHALFPESHFTVKAFEGMGKGAIVEKGKRH